MNESEVPHHVHDANAGQDHPEKSPTGFSQSCFTGNCLSDASAMSANEASVWVPERLALDPNHVKIVHFSGEKKMWHRNHLDSQVSDAVWVENLLMSNLGPGVNLGW